MDKKPKQEFRSGSVHAVVWENTITKDGEEFKVLNTEIYKTYKKEDKYEKTNNYSQNDLARLKLVVDEALRFVYIKGAEDGE